MIDIYAPSRRFTTLILILVRLVRGKSDRTQHLWHFLIYKTLLVSSGSGGFVARLVGCSTLDREWEHWNEILVAWLVVLDGYACISMLKLKAVHFIWNILPVVFINFAPAGEDAFWRASFAFVAKWFWMVDFWDFDLLVTWWIIFVRVDFDELALVL